MKKKLFVVVFLVLVAAGSYGAGYLHAERGGPLAGSAAWARASL